MMNEWWMNEEWTNKSRKEWINDDDDDDDNKWCIPKSLEVPPVDLGDDDGIFRLGDEELAATGSVPEVVKVVGDGFGRFEEAVLPPLERSDSVDAAIGIPEKDDDNPVKEPMKG